MPRILCWGMCVEKAFVALLTCLVATPGTAGDAPRRPNILFLFSDDQRPDTIHALGNQIIQTPNLDRLVREGTVLTRAFSPNPLCLPARKEILSGCPGLRNGRANFSGRFDPDQVPLPRVLREAGYHTWYVGKWHTEGRPGQHGFEESLGLFMGGGGRVEQVDHAGRPATGYQGWVFQTEDGRKFPEQGIGLTPDISRRFADAAVEFIRRRPPEPFFLHVSFTAPHDPLLIPPGWEGKYDPAKIPLPPNFLAEHPFDHGNLRGRDEQLFRWPRTPEEIRRELAAYYAVISHLDEQIGRVLDALRETGQDADTVVVFSSDQGLAVGSHGLRGKQNLYDHTVGVPLVFAGPAIPKGARRPAQCYLRDLYPTFCELAGANVPNVVDAKSLLPVIEGKVERLYPAVFGYFGDVQRAIRTDRWKLIDYPKLDRCQLFDLQADPDERTDLSNDPAAAEALADLKRQLAAWRRRAGDPTLNSPSGK
jgi:arylsulfatase A-like enzyme